LGSELIIGELLPAEAKRELCWQCWLKHVQYLSILTQHVISREQLVTLATLIDEHQAAFKKAHRPYVWNSALYPNPHPKRALNLIQARRP
jgi:hypothetical protein